MLAAEKLVTADELLAMPDGKHYELWKGVLRKVSPVSLPHADLAAQLARHIGNYLATNRLGRVYVELGIRLTRNPDSVVGPDVAFISRARLEKAKVGEGFFPDAPDLAVEVISPSETDQDVQEKVAAYLNAGTTLVWVVRPKRRTVTVHYPDGTARTLTEAMTLSGEDVLPGFSLALKELFA